MDLLKKINPPSTLPNSVVVIAATPVAKSADDELDNKEEFKIQILALGAS